MSSSLKSVLVPVTDGIPSTLELTLTQVVPAGTLLRLRASSVTMLRAIAVASVTVDDGAGPVSLPVVHRFSWEAMQRDWMWHLRTLSIAVVSAPTELAKGSRVAVACKSVDGDSDGSGATIADLRWVLYLGKVAGPGSVEFGQVSEPVELQFAAGPVDHLEAVLKPNGQILVERFDIYGNPTRPDASDDLQVWLGSASSRCPATPGRTSTAVVAIDRRAANVRPGTRGYVLDAVGRSATSNALPVTLDETPIYFGEFHWHTDFSGDGERTLQAALTSARDELALDFAGPADHLAPDGTYVHRLPVEQAEICRRFDNPGRFCTIPGAELSGRYGHANLYAADFDTFLQIIKRFPYELLPAWREMLNDYPLEILSALCPEGRAMIVPHHTNMDSWVDTGIVHSDGRPFWCALHWPPPSPLMQQGTRLVEIVQNRGAFEAETPDPEWRGHWGGFGGSAQTALMRGHRLGFVGGSDNHTGWPTRLAGKVGYGGLTAIQAPRLDSGSLFDALYSRRCYATSGARIVADATLNGYPIGSELRLAPGAPRIFQIVIHGTAPLAAVQIISMGSILADFPIEDDMPDFDVTWMDDRPGRPLRDVVYYVRARQVDGHCAWLSPFWVDLAV